MTAFSAQDQRQRRTLLLVLALNFSPFPALGVAGWLADSSALLPNAADNASDSAVHLISFLAVGRPPRWKKTAATLSGVLLLLFAIGVLADVGRRWLTGTEPIGPTMMVMAFAAAFVNLWCLKLLRQVDNLFKCKQCLRQFTGHPLGSIGDSPFRQSVFAIHWVAGTGELGDLKSRQASEAALSDGLRQEVVIGYKVCGYHKTVEKKMLKRTAAPMNTRDRDPSLFSRLLSSLRQRFREAVVAAWEPPPPSSRPRQRR